ncbi:MAG: chromate transporter [Eubacteriales bacterium]|nr:chromate transporter [Eubacteriales bacterium]
MIYWQLFLSFLQIGMFSFGGGYAALPLIQGQVVTGHQWLTQSEFTDLITISQMTPGPIAVNSATFVGTRLAGFGGAAAATLGCILPSCVLVTLLAWLYLRYRKLSLLQGVLDTLRPAVVAMIAAAGVSIMITAFWQDGRIALQTIKPDSILIFIAAVYLLKKKNMNPILVMTASGVAKLAVQGALLLLG